MAIIKIGKDVKQPYSDELHEKIFSLGGHIFQKRDCYASSSCDFINIPRTTDIKGPYDDAVKVGEIATREGSPCHASMRYVGWCLTSSNLCIPVLRDKSPMYWSWLVKESPWAGVFLSKNPDVYLTKGVMINTCSQEVTRGMALGAAIATRSLTEHVGHFALWFDLVERGCDPTYAYAIAGSFRCNSVSQKETYNKSSTLYRHSLNHAGIIPSNWTVKDFNRWMMHKPMNSTSAECSFSDCNLSSADEFFGYCVGKPKTTGSGSGRFSSSNDSKYMLYEDLLDFYVSNEEDILKHCCPDYTKRTLGDVVIPAVVVEKKKPTNNHEPEEDM